MPQHRCGKCEKFFRSEIPDECKHCGATDSLTQVSFTDSESSPQFENGSRSASEMIRSGADLYNGIKLLLTSLLIIGLGCLLIFASDLRDDPRRIGVSDVVRGGFTALVGFIVLAGAVYFFQRSAKGN